MRPIHGLLSGGSRDLKRDGTDLSRSRKVKMGVPDYHQHLTESFSDWVPKAYNDAQAWFGNRDYSQAPIFCASF